MIAPAAAEDNNKTLRVNFDNVRYYLHFPESKSAYALKVKSIVENDFLQMHKYFNYRPQSDVHFNIIDAKSANGFATVFPRIQVELNDFPPVGEGFLTSSNDWVRSLVIHEYTHILHMDMTSGIFQTLRKIIGSSAKVNGVVPRWFSEGIAVWSESTFTNEGRLRNKTIKRIVAERLLDPNFCQSIDCLDSPMTYPYRSYQYWGGSHFMAYVESRYPNSISCIVKKNSEMIPFLLNYSFKFCVKQNIQEMWKEFKVSFLNKNKYLVGKCPISSGCELVSAKDISIMNWQKGVIDNRFIAFAIDDNFNGHTELAQTHKLVYINKKTKNRKTVVFNSSIENIYRLNQDEFIVVLEGYHKREFRLFPGNTILKYSGKIENPMYIFNNHALEYKHNRWLVKSLNGDIAYQHDKMRNISNPNVKNGKFIFQDEKKITQQALLKKQELSKTASIESDEYQSYNYLSPTYLMFMVGQFGNLNTLQTQTTLSDPLKKQKISVNLETYFTNMTDSPYGGNLDYQYSFKEDMTIGIGHNNYKTRNIFLERINTFESTSVYSARTSKFNDIDTRVGVNLSKTLTDDFISRRVSETFSLYTGLNYQTNGIYDFFKGIDWGLTGFRQGTIGYTEFYGFKNKLISDFWINDNMNFYFRSNYTKYFKDDYHRGFINGGGASSFLTGSFYLELYSLSFGDLIGNEVSTNRLEFENNLINIYRGWGTFPAYFKNLKLFYGTEYAKADVIYFSNDIGIEEEITSVHAGLRLTGDAAYYIPTKAELILSKVLDNRYEGVGILFLLQGSLF